MGQILRGLFVLRKTDTGPNNSITRLLTHQLAFERGTQNQLASLVLDMGDLVASIQCTFFRLIA